MAAAAYAANLWDEKDWRLFGQETGTGDILASHPRLYRSLGFGDDDYPEAALDVLKRLLNEAVEDEASQKERMELLANFMPDLPKWVNENAPVRTKRLFNQYVSARDISELPEQWVEHHNVFDDALAQADPPAVTLPPAYTNEHEPRPHPPTAPTRNVFEQKPAAPDDVPEVAMSSQRSIFIVHGHDEAALNSIRIYVHKQTKIMPISLAEEPGRGSTIIEKFEASAAEASFVIVLLTPDDVGQTVAAFDAGSPPSPRARQNVVLELGYFIGKIGRQNVLVVDASVERPSDLAGLSYVAYPGANWKDDLRVELAAAGLTH